MIALLRKLSLQTKAAIARGIEATALRSKLARKKSRAGLRGWGKLIKGKIGYWGLLQKMEVEK